MRHENDKLGGHDRGMAIRLVRRRVAWIFVVLVAVSAILAIRARRALTALRVVVPVDGVPPARVHSTFGAPRDGGARRHQGVDIFARRGTPVRAVHRGMVVAVRTLRLGGRTVTVLGTDGILTYYAHLDRWAPGMRAGAVVARGDMLGTVGNTGNARTTPSHLHFEVRPLVLGLRPIDPAPLMRRATHTRARATRPLIRRAGRYSDPGRGGA